MSLKSSWNSLLEQVIYQFSHPAAIISPQQSLQKWPRQTFFVRCVALGKNLLGVPREKTLHVKALKKKTKTFFAWIVKDNHRNASSFKLQSEMCFSQSACSWMLPLHHVVWHFSLPLTHAGFTFPFHIFCSKCKMFCSVLILHLVSQIGQYSARTRETQTPQASGGLQDCRVHSHHAADSHRDFSAERLRFAWSVYASWEKTI